MAGIVLESIGACGRVANCLRFLRVSQRPFVLCPSWATLEHRCRRQSSSDGAADGGKDQLHQMKTIQLGEGQLGKNSDGLKVTAAPPDPNDKPGEKRTELPYEIRPEIPMEAQPNRIQPTPLEVKPPNPQPIICSSDYEASSDPNIESEPKSYSTSSNELPPPPVINLMDDKNPSPPPPTTTELDKAIDSPFISIECDLDYPSTTVHEFVNKRYQARSIVKPERPRQDSSSNDPKNEITQSPNESKDGQNAPTPLTSQDDSRPVSKEPGSIATLDLKVKPQKSKTEFQSSPLADNRQFSSRPESNSVGSGWPQGSSFDLPGEGNTAGEKPQVEPTNYSSAKDEYGSQYQQIYGKDQDKKATSTADNTSEDVVDNEVINQWVDKFKRLYMAENAAFGLNNENDQQNSGSKDEKDGNPLQTMMMKDSKSDFGNKDTAEPSPFTPDKSSPANTLPEKASTFYDPIFFKNSRSSHEGDFPLEATEANHKAATDKKGENRLLNMMKIDNKWVFKDTAEPSSSQKIENSPAATLSQKIEAKPKASKDEHNRTTAFSAPKDENITKSATTMIKKNNVWVLRNKDSAESITPSPGAPLTEKSSPEGTLPLKIVGKHKAELKESKRDLSASKKNAQLDTSKPIKAVLGQSSAAGKSKAEVSGSPAGATQGSSESALDFNSLSKTTEEIVAMFKEDNSDDLNAKEGGETLDGMTMSESTTDSQADVPKSLNTEDGKLFQAQADKEDEYFSKLLDFEESITAHEDEKDKEKGQFISRSDSMENSQTETTSMLPRDLYDPLSSEVSSYTPPEIAGREESEDLNPDQEVPDVKGKKEKTTVPTPQATTVTEKNRTDEKPVKKEKPQLEQGELSMKLLDMESVDAPTSAMKTPPSPAKMPSPAEKSLPVEKMPSLGAESREKSLFQKIFEKILGGRGKNDGKRQMSTYTAKRQLSTSCTFAIPPSGSLNVDKNFRHDSPARTLVIMESASEFYEENQELKPAKVHLQEPDMLTPELSLFDKNSKDLTEIKGGSPSCKSPKKTPLELLREKQNSKKIKILGGSEECAKKLKALKELNKNTDDDCDRDQFSIPHFLGQLRDLTVGTTLIDSLNNFIRETMLNMVFITFFFRIRYSSVF